VVLGGHGIVRVVVHDEAGIRCLKDAVNLVWLFEEMLAVSVLQGKHCRARSEDQHERGAGSSSTTASLDEEESRAEEEGLGFVVAVMGMSITPESHTTLQWLKCARRW